MIKKAHGFTIVELLIVIVVIAILAAISIVAYTGIQNRTYDAAVNSDLNGIAKQLEIGRINSTADIYPYGNPALNSVVSINAAKSAYRTSPSAVYNLVICAPTISNAKEFLILATSKSGSQFSIKNGGSVTKNTGSAWSVTSADVCNTINSGWIASGAGYSSGDTATGPWRTWAGGN